MCSASNSVPRAQYWRIFRQSFPERMVVGMVGGGGGMARTALEEIQSVVSRE